MIHLNDLLHRDDASLHPFVVVQDETKLIVCKQNAVKMRGSIKASFSPCYQEISDYNEDISFVKTSEGLDIMIGDEVITSFTPSETDALFDLLQYFKVV